MNIKSSIQKYKIQVNRITLFVLLFLNAFAGQSQNAEEIFQKGNSLWSGNKFKEALVYVDSSLNMDSSLYQRYLFRADIKVDLGMIESAIIDVTKAIERCKHTTWKYHVSDYYLERSNLHVQNNDSTAAVDDLDKSISINQKNWQARNKKSQFLIGKGKLQEALSDLNNSLEIDDNQAESFILRGKLLMQMGKIPKACSDFSTVYNWGFDEYEQWIKENCK